MEIVKAAIKASQNQPTTLIEEDTNLLILLLYYAEANNRGLYFCLEISTVPKVYNISEMKQVLGSEMCSQLLFIHAFTDVIQLAHFQCWQKVSIPETCK